jgi:hypothetical protein
VVAVSDDFAWAAENLMTSLERARGFVELMRSARPIASADLAKVDDYLRRAEIHAVHMTVKERV